MISRYGITVVYNVIKCRNYIAFLFFYTSKSGARTQAGSQNGQRRNNGYRNHMELQGVLSIGKRRVK